MRKIIKKGDNSKKALLLQKASDLFSRHGIRRISVEEICKEAGVSKMTFYRNFKDKTHIATQILDKIYSECWDEFYEIKKMHITFEEKIKKIFVMKAAFTERFSREFMKDIIDGTLPEIKEYIEKDNERSRKEIKKMFSRAQKEGDIRPDVKIEFIMYMIFKMREIFKDAYIQGLYPDPPSFIKEAFSFVYYGILTKRKYSSF